MDETEDLEKAETFLSSYAGRRTTWATVGENPLQQEKNIRIRSRAGTLASSTHTSYRGVTKSKAGDIETSFQHDSIPEHAIATKENTGLITGKKSTTNMYTTALVNKASERLDEYSTENMGMLIAKRLLAVFICVAILAVSIALRFTVLDYDLVFPDDGNMTTLPIGNMTTTAMMPNVTTTMIMNTTTMATSPMTSPMTTTTPMTTTPTTTTPMTTMAMTTMVMTTMNTTAVF